MHGSDRAMSLRKRRFIGELTKKDLVRKFIAGGIIISLLFAAWMFLPTIIDYLVGGSRGNYNTHAPYPGDHETYDLNAIPFEPHMYFDPSVFDPALLTPELLEMLRDLFDPQNVDIPSDFSDFNTTTFNLPLFYIADIGTSSAYSAAMRHNVYDTINAAGTEWVRSNSTLGTFDHASDTATYAWSPVREVTFTMSTTSTLDMRMPMFGYNPKYVVDSMRYVRNTGTYYIPDDPSDGVLSKDMYGTVSARAFGLPDYPEPTNFTYAIAHDPAMTIAVENSIKAGPSDVPASLPYTSNANYLQIPGVTSTRDLAPYLSTHPRFNAAYSYLHTTLGLNKASSATHTILQAIVAYLYANYDVFTSFPERPASGEDMVEWFLGRPKSTYPNAGGTPYDFAVAFTMLARAFDIPTRVVTGYLDWDGDNIITLSNVYAWAEALIPQLAPVAFPWINFEFLPGFNNTQMFPSLSDMIWIDTPASGQTFPGATGIPLNLRMYSNGTITDITYSLDGAANQSVFGMQVPIPGHPGAFYVNHSFNVASPGMHSIRAWLHTTNGVVGSITNTFIVGQDAGYFVSVVSPANNSVTSSSTIILDYTSVNASAVTAASLTVIDTGTGIPAILDSPLAPLPSQATTFTLGANGTFNLIVTITTTLGAYTSLHTLGHVIFSVNPSDLIPSAWFYAMQTHVVVGQAVQFIHSGSNGNLPATYQWNFGDGTPNATMEHPVHYYSTPGVYTVTLTITDADGDVDTFTLSNLVTVTTNLVPDPVIAVNATRILPGQSVWFNHTGSPGEPPYTRSWDFGDGYFAGNVTPVVHQYTAVGNYTVFLTITDGSGDTRASIPLLIVVSNDLYPTAFFTANGAYTSQFIVAGGSVQFAHVGSEGNATATFQWNFGDGSPNATVKNPLHQFTAAGSYTVTLTVTDGDGDRDVYRWINCVYVNLLPTQISVDFTPKDVEIFESITISGYLQYTNSTGIGSQDVSLRIEYWLGSTLQGFDTAVVPTANGTGYYSHVLQVLMSSDFIRVIATFAGTSTLLSSTAQVLG